MNEILKKYINSQGYELNVEMDESTADSYDGTTYYELNQGDLLIADHVDNDKILEMLIKLGYVDPIANNLEARNEAYVFDVLSLIKKDPKASDYSKNYDETHGYLLELIEKDGSILGGLIRALERYLGK